MAEFNNDAYIADQIEKQYRNPRQSSVKAHLPNETFKVDDMIMQKILMSDVEGIQNMVRDRETTYEEIAKCFWNQIIKQKQYNAVITLNPKVIEQAAALTYDESHDILYGIPVLLKDNIGTKEMTTTAGAAILKDFICDEDAEIVKQLKAKGALIIGKTNMSEWANFMSTESSNGYSAVGGQTLNAFSEFDAGGSSSGSAVAAALHMAPVTVGTETAGSIIYPASQNSVIGLKPTLGRVSQDRIIPISKSYDTAGPIAKTVKDTYYLFRGLAHNVREAHWDVNALTDLKIGIVNNDFVRDYYRDEDPEIIERVKFKLEQMQAICSWLEFDGIATDVPVEDVLKYEFKEGIKSYFEQYAREKLTLEDIYTFNESNLVDYAPYNQELIRQSIDEVFEPAAIEKQIRDNQSITRRALDAAFEEHDVLLTLSNYCTSVYAPAGYPAITIPCGLRKNGEPIGVTFIGRYDEDERLMEIGYAYEQNRKALEP